MITRSMKVLLNRPDRFLTNKLLRVCRLLFWWQVECVWFLTLGKVVKRSSSSTKQNICRLIADMTMRRLAVNTTRLPSFLPGPNILYTKSSRAGEILIKRTTRSTWEESLRNYCKDAICVSYIVILFMVFGNGILKTLQNDFFKNTQHTAVEYGLHIDFFFFLMWWFWSIGKGAVMLCSVKRFCP